MAPPSLTALAIQNIAPNVVVEAYLLLIGHKDRPLPGPCYPSLQTDQPIGVIGGKNESALVIVEASLVSNYGEFAIIKTRVENRFPDDNRQCS